MHRDDTRYDGCPPTPDGVDEGAHVTSSEEMRLAPLDNSPSDKGKRSLPWVLGLVACAVGGAVSSTDAAALSPFLIGYGLVAAAQDRSIKKCVLAVAVTLAASVVAGIALGDVTYVISGVIVSLSGILVALLALTGKLTSGKAVAIIAGISLVSLGADEVVARSYGTTMAEYMEELLDYYGELLDMSSVSTVLAFQSIRDVYTTLWPLAYVVNALIEYVLAHAGARLAVNQMGDGAPQMLRLQEFDMPFWAVALFVAALLGTALEETVDAFSSDAVLMLCANVLMSLRFALAAQGIAVLLWFVGSRRMGCAGSGFLTVFALYLEVQFYVMALVGLVDIWANFRHLPRGRRVTIQDGSSGSNDSTGQD